MPYSQHPVYFTERDGCWMFGLTPSTRDRKLWRNPTVLSIKCFFWPQKAFTMTGPKGQTLWHLTLAPGAGNATMYWCGVGRSKRVQSIFIRLCRDTFIVTLGNAITSILAGFAIFSVLGYMSQELGVPVNQVAKAGEAKDVFPFPLCLGVLRSFPSRMEGT